MEYSTISRNETKDQKEKHMNYEISFHLTSENRSVLRKMSEKLGMEEGEILSRAFRDFISELGIDVSQNSITSTISVLKFAERLHTFLDHEQLSFILVKQIIRRRGPLVTFYTDSDTYHGLDRLFLMFAVPVNRDILVEIILTTFAKRNGGEIV